MKVYLIEEGEYEDREPVHIFTTRELAQEYTDKYCGPTADVTEFELWDRPVPRAMFHVRSARVLPDGTVDQPRATDYETDLAHTEWRAISQPSHMGGMFVLVEGRDEDRVEVEYARRIDEAKRA